MASCERLIHPSVDERGERSRQLRLAGTLFVAPFPVAAGVAQLFAAFAGTAPALAMICAVFGLFWGLAAVMLTTARRRFIEIAALSLGSVSVAGLLAAAGGLASPLALLAAALVIEPYRVAESRRALAAGAGAAVAALVAGTLLPLLGAVPLPAGAPSAAHWIVPLLYAATLGFRSPLLRQDPPAVLPEKQEENCFERHMDALVLRLNRTGDVMRVSGRAGELLNVPADILLGSGFFDRIHVADRVAYLCALSDVHAGAEHRMADLRLRKAATDGMPAAGGFRQFGIELFAADQPGTIVAVVRSAEERAELEAEVARAQADERAAALESERLMAAVSHEMRTPLNAILGFSETLLTEIFGKFADERQREHARLIHEAGQHLLEVVNATLEISKVGSGTYVLEPEATSFLDVAEASLALTRGQDRSIAVDLAIAPDLAPVWCDRRALQQILINLLSNAVKFSRQNGKVTVAGGWNGDRFEFSVSDNGVGIGADDLGRIGEPFMQVRTEATRDVEGTGLGLALVKGLVHLHGGRMTIESTPGEGTRVTVSLPLGVMKDAKDAQSSAIDKEWDDENYRKTA